MNSNPTPSTEAQVTLDCLRNAVSKALERKRRLGQYSVQWKDNAPFIEGDDAPDNLRLVEQSVNIEEVS
jgi:hypothetical protein